MKASYLWSIWIVIYSIWITLKVSIIVIYYSIRYCHTSCREKTNDLLQWWAKHFVDVAKINYHIEDPYHLSLDKNKRYVIMTNHCSYYDIPLSVLAIKGNIRMIAKQELFYVPLWGKALKVSEFIPLDRKKPRKALAQLEIAKKKLASGIIIWVAPEGTRSKNGQLQRLKKGAFLLAKHSQSMIIPIYIDGTHRIRPSGNILFNLKQKVTIHIAKPIDSLDYKHDTQSLISAVEHILSGKTINVNVT